jgi:beta-lactamase regulating signal transducer with metallopeptidase domain
MSLGGLDMNAVAWLSREEVVALGWTLLHFCWQGTAVAVVYAFVNRLTSRASSTVRYAVTLAALLLMPAIVIGTFAEELRVATPARPTADAALYLSAAHSVIRTTPILHELPLASSLEEQSDWLAIRADRMLPWVDALWFAGVLLLAIRALGGWLQLGLIRRRARRMVPNEVERAFLRLCEQVRVGRKVVLRASDEVISPLAMGVWRATVILPISAVLSLPSEELEAVIAHELGHIRRWDYLWNLLQTAIESVLFFHPAVWWLSRTVRERREICCDEIAVQSCAGPDVYARALLRLEEQRTTKLRLAMALGGCGGSLLSRVRKVLGEDMAMENRMTSGVSVAAVGALVIALLLGPRIGEAVAAPLANRAQPMVAHVIAALPAAVVSRIGAAPSRLIIPDPPAPIAPKAHICPAPTLHPAPPAPLPMSLQHLQAQNSTRIVIAPAVSSPAVFSPAVFSPADEKSFTVKTAALSRIAVNMKMAFATVFGSQESTGTGSSWALGEGTGQGAGTGSAKGSGTAYLDGMRNAGYPLDLNNDLNSLVALRSVNVTPEYAKSMSEAGLGKPTVHELIALKSMGVTPEYVASLKQTGVAPANFHEVVTEKSLGITPEYAAEMKQKGFGDLNLHELITMKSMGITPEYAAEMKQKGFGELSVHELITMKSLGVTPEYAAEMKQKGFGTLSVHELVSLKAQGMTPEYAGWLKQQFPQASMDDIRRAAIFHLDDKFVADAKTHGFDDKDIDKLLRLKMSGLLDN